MTSLLLLNARLAQANLITGTDFDVKLLSLNRKITSNKSKHLFVETELKKLEAKVTLKKIAHKIIWYFSQCIDI